jgi:curved DNA-binding protein CbpA
LPAAHYHPNNRETGSPERFALVNQAFEILSNAEQRASYDSVYDQRRTEPIRIFTSRDFPAGIDGEPHRRMGILCLLYNRRRSNQENPGISILEFESLMSCPREHLMFAMWYLKAHDLVSQADNSDYVIAGGGADYVEAHLPSHEILYRLLKAAETGSAHAVTVGEGQGPDQGASGR